MHAGLSVLRRPAGCHGFQVFGIGGLNFAEVFGSRRLPLGMSVLRRPARRQPDWLRRDMDCTSNNRPR